MDTPTGHGQAFHRATGSSSGSPPSISTLASAGSLSALMANQSLNTPTSNMNGVNQVKATEPVFPIGAVPSSPPTLSQSPNSNRNRQRSVSIPGGASNLPRLLTPFDTGDIKILLLENVSTGAVNMLKEQGYQVDFHTKAWSEQELCEKIGDYHVVGIRSKTKLTANVFRKAQKVSQKDGREGNRKKMRIGRNSSKDEKW